jgi:hypothetical protein
MVDGASMNDPPTGRCKPFNESMLVVPGAKPGLPLWPRGAVTRHPTTPLAMTTGFLRHRQPADARRAAYPVHLFCGLGDDVERWLTGGGGAANIPTPRREKPAANPAGSHRRRIGTSNGPIGGRGSAS